ncbi:MAG: lamin tail domain-containing protein [Candidatus Marinimicrobia bacterium]|nr:lamin tail domain-containing protein [Candidatus Neomarinimicrobiota bacterium]|tara:strand:+ start:486 stop:2225 length:1740 start_codon:yes stop_codon:yes gene_type:complete
MRYIIFIILISMVNASNVRIMTYNVLNYQDENEREDDYVLILDFVQPDLIIAQEIVGQSGYSNFKSDVLDIIDSDHWSGAPFTNQSAQQDIALYYRDDIFSFISTNVVYSAQSSGTRDVIEWVMLHSSSGIEFNIYGVHLKASSGTSNANERLQETTILRNYLNDHSSDSYFIVGGDFNIYSNNSSSEPAFDMLTASSDDNDGRLFDPIDRIGHWHNNSSYADVHTQSPRTSNFGGGATGGMDDRFDWLFVSQSLLDASSSMHYVDDTYWAFGNDGNHFNDAINDGNNNSVSDEIADALHDGSDHLPVYMDVWFDDLTYSDQGVMITEIMANPSSVSDSYGEWFEIMNMTDSTIDIHGWSIKDLQGDEHEILSDQMTIPVLPDEYFVLARNGDQTLNGGINVDYEYDGFSLSNTEDEVILQDISGAIVDEVHYSSGWPFSSGVSMEIHDLLVDNQLSENWFYSTMAYGNGDLGSPGIPFDGTLNIEESSIMPNGFSLISLYPNPFNPEITIHMDNREQGRMSIEIFDLSGHKVETLINTVFITGDHKVTWDASGNSSGMYFFKFTIGNTILIRKALFIK